MCLGWTSAGHTWLARHHCPAGLLGGERFHGRVNPQLGHGQPPPEQYDDTRTVAEHHKTWHPQHSHLLQKRCALGVSAAGRLPLQQRLSRGTASGACLRHVWRWMGALQQCPWQLQHRHCCSMALRPV